MCFIVHAHDGNNVTGAYLTSLGIFIFLLWSVSGVLLTSLSPSLLVVAFFFFCVGFGKLVASSMKEQISLQC